MQAPRASVSLRSDVLRSVAQIHRNPDKHSGPKAGRVLQLFGRLCVAGAIPGGGQISACDRGKMLTRRVYLESGTERER